MESLTTRANRGASILGAWQRFINDVLWDYLNRFRTAYLEDILIYSNNMKEHKEHVRPVPNRQRMLEKAGTTDYGKAGSTPKGPNQVMRVASKIFLLLL